MARRKSKKPQTLMDAKRYYKQLLYEASGGNLGTKPETLTKTDSMTFAEKRGLLDSIIKISQLELKSSENDEGESGFDLIRKGLQDGGGESGSGRDYGTTEDSGDDPSPFSETSDNG